MAKRACDRDSALPVRVLDGLCEGLNVLDGQRVLVATRDNLLTQLGLWVGRRCLVLLARALQGDGCAVGIHARRGSTGRCCCCCCCASDLAPLVVVFTVVVVLVVATIAAASASAATATATATAVVVAAVLTTAAPATRAPVASSSTFRFFMQSDSVSQRPSFPRVQLPYRDITAN